MMKNNAKQRRNISVSASLALFFLDLIPLNDFELRGEAKKKSKRTRFIIMVNVTYTSTGQWIFLSGRCYEYDTTQDIHIYIHLPCKPTSEWRIKRAH